MSSSKAKGKVGRKPKYNPAIHPQLAEAWAAAGKIDEEIAEKLGIAVSTIYAWQKRHPAFSEAIKRGKTPADENVERSLYERACGYSHPEDKIFQHEGSPVVVPTIRHYPPDTAACIFWLKNRLPEKWRDKQDLEHSGAGGGPVQVAFVSGIPPREKSGDAP